MKTFLEIGCADFDTLLPLAARGWRGFFVEPIERHCESLRRQARKVGVPDDQIEIAQLAISDLWEIKPSEQNFGSFAYS